MQSLPLVESICANGRWGACIYRGHGHLWRMQTPFVVILMKSNDMYHDASLGDRRRKNTHRPIDQQTINICQHLMLRSESRSSANRKVWHISASCIAILSNSRMELMFSTSQRSSSHHITPPKISSWMLGWILGRSCGDHPYAHV